MRALVLALFIGTFVGCTATASKSPDVSNAIHKSLDQAGLKDVSVKQDRDNGVVTLGGHVDNDASKLRAESIAKSLASGQVVANEIAVLPPNRESDAKTVASDLDEGIKKNLDAALIQNRLSDGVRSSVTKGVVTLTGEVNSQEKRTAVAKVASSVPNVTQVVNELQVKHQKATSSR